MPRQPNPYHPGFNQPPAVFAGREGVVDDFVEALAVAALDHRTPRPLVLAGPRGVGKTVTLGELARIAGERFAWPAVHVEAKPTGLLEDLALRLEETAQLLAGAAPRRTPERRRGPRVSGGKVSAGGFGFGAEVQLSAGEDADASPARRLEAALTAAARLAVDRGAGLVVPRRAAGRPPADLAVVGAVLQEHVPDDGPLVVVIAALPSLRTVRGKRGLPTYLERAEWHALGALDDDATTRALAGPAQQARRPMTPEAVAELTDLSGGYPYAI